MDWKKKSCLWVLLISLVFLGTGCGKGSREDPETSKVKYQAYEAKTATEKVGGMLVDDIRSDMILDIPEDYFFNLKEDMTWDELIARIGEPSGTVGSGIVREFWRIGEDKYAVTATGTNKIAFEIWTGEAAAPGF